MTGAADGTIVCLITAPPEGAEPIASELVERRLAACVNELGPVRSTYRWDGAVQRDSETLLVVKTTRAALAAIERLLQDLHPYDTFELIALDATGGSERYLRWIEESVGPLEPNIRPGA
jgi:periplasmic divalent cation tolerance protein